MSSFSTIVIGVDGSSESAAAVEWAARRLAEGGTLHVVHASSPLQELGHAVLQHDWGPQRAEARRALTQEWTEPARRLGHDVTPHFIEDDPADAILAVATETQADLIVVGPHGGSSTWHSLGSVVRKLLHHGTRPLIVARPGDSPGGSTEPSANRPVVAFVGYGESGDEAALWASDFAASAGLELRLVHAIGYRPVFPADGPVDTLAAYLGPEVAEDWGDAELQRLCRQLVERHPGLKVTTTLEHGPATHAIQAESNDVELIVLGKRHGNPLSRVLISPRLHRAIARVPVTVAVVPTCSTDR